MRRAILVFLTYLFVFVNGCGVSESDHQKIVAERDALNEKLFEIQNQIALLEEESSALHHENQTLKDQIKKLIFKREKKRARSKPSSKRSGSTAKDRFYTVKKGDSLWKIYRRTGVSVATLIKLNDIKGSQIKIGQKLILTP